MLKHPDLPDNPLVPENKVITDVRGSREWWRFQHRYDMDQPDLLDIYARWHAVTAPRGAMLLGEVNITDPGRLGRHTAGRGPDAVFWFGLMEHRWEPVTAMKHMPTVAFLSVPMTISRSRPDRTFHPRACAQNRASPGRS